MESSHTAAVAKKLLPENNLVDFDSLVSEKKKPAPTAEEKKSLNDLQKAKTGEAPKPVMVMPQYQPGAAPGGMMLQPYGMMNANHMAMQQQMQMQQMQMQHMQMASMMNAQMVQQQQYGAAAPDFDNKNNNFAGLPTTSQSAVSAGFSAFP